MARTTTAAADATFRKLVEAERDEAATAYAIERELLDAIAYNDTADERVRELAAEYRMARVGHRQARAARVGAQDGRDVAALNPANRQERIERMMADRRDAENAGDDDRAAYAREWLRAVTGAA